MSSPFFPSSSSFYGEDSPPVRRKFGPRAPTKEELACVIGSKEALEAERLYREAQEAKQRERESTESKPQEEAPPTCCNVFERSRGDRRAGQRCDRPAAGPTGLCRVCQNSSKRKPQPPIIRADQTWMSGLLEGLVVSAEPEPDGITWPQPDEDGCVNFTPYWMRGGGDYRELEGILARHLQGKITDDALADVFLAFLDNILVVCKDRVWWYRTSTRMWTSNSVTSLLTQLSRNISAAVEGMLSRLPPPPAKGGRGEPKREDPHQGQRESLEECLVWLRSTARCKGFYARLIAIARQDDGFESRKNMDVRFLPCAGGHVLDFETGEVLPRTFRHHFDYEAPVDPSLATAEARLEVLSYFEHLLWRDGAPATPEMVTTFLKILGIFISGDISDQSLLFLKGEASNGKSQLVSIIASMLGDAYQPASDGAFVATDGQGASPAISALMGGKRLAGISELNRTVRLSSNVIKRLTSTEEISYRPLYQNVCKGKLVCHILVATNTAVQFDSIDEGVRRRVYCLEFPVRFVDLQGEAWTDDHRAQNVLPRRPEVIARMHSPECRAALLLLLCEHWRQWKSSGSSSLPKFPGLDNTSQDFLEECAAARSDVREFVAERLVSSPGSNLSTTEVLEAYRAWSSNMRTTSSWLKERLVELSITSVKVRGKMYYKNVAFSPQGLGTL